MINIYIIYDIYIHPISYILDIYPIYIYPDRYISYIYIHIYIYVYIASIRKVCHGKL